MSRLGAAILTLFRQGITAEKIALTIALGAVISLCPLPVLPTFACVLMAIFLRLNLGLIQMVNWMLLPAQWLLMLPFIRLGEYMFRADAVALSAREAIRLLRQNPLESLPHFARSFLHGIGAWAVISPLLLAGLYFTSLPLLRRLGRRRAAAK